MSELVVVGLALALLLFLLACETPVAMALGISGGAGLLLLGEGVAIVGSELANAPYRASASYALTIIPMYILIGTLALHGRLAQHVYAISSYVFRRLPGGLGCATVAACAGFAAVSGSSAGSAAVMSRVSITEMVRYGYPASFAAGVVASAGTLGAMIPPSVILVLYSILVRESTGAMLAAGIVPGILSALSYILYILWAGRRLPRIAAGQTPGGSAAKVSPSATVSVGSTGSATTTDGDGGAGEVGRPAAVDVLAGEPAPTLRTLPWRGGVGVLIIFTIVMGGIYTGITTPTESGAIGAVVTIVLAVIERRKEGLAAIWSTLVTAFREAAEVTSMVLMILVGSFILTAMLVVSRTPNELTEFLVGLSAPAWVIVGLLLLAVIPLGMALEGLSILVIVVPLAYPVVTELGYSGIWLGIMIVKMIELGLITPPVGISAYIVAGASPDVTLEETFRGIVPFAAMDLAIILLLFSWPGLVTWLPSIVGG